MWISILIGIAVGCLSVIYRKSIRGFYRNIYYAWKLVQQGTAAPKVHPFNQDRLAILSDVYVQLRDHLIASQKQLEAANETLEEKVKQRTKDLEELSIRDPLTGLYNRRHFNERMKEELTRATRHKLTLAIVYIDLDNFKNYNDANGHPTGDALLEQFGKLLKGLLRASCIPCRIGGEEFCIILPHTNISGALIVAEKIRLLTENTEFPNADKQPLGRITCSLGVSEYPTVSSDMEQLILSADNALYLAKKKGRNQVVSALDSEVSKVSQVRKVS